jgi:membrane-associated phospholipid phosphatase
VLACYVSAMAFSLVYLGEHFVIDELAGWGCAIAGYFAGSRLLDRARSAAAEPGRARAAGAGGRRGLARLPGRLLARQISG